ncbi:putative RNA-directed DNA polymerase from transposon BS [Araneus ventricosus]|uniref:Putative RNA-directed DNA polymerase from transposon BS n=1 Tax=Araneus ventricosus TaxID=182803 RepID=A0A4Y2QHK4_ARAVE|nr:putative RNA-directed DNA polymerase from transposon BS [Araneus ventricosus]
MKNPLNNVPAHTEKEKAEIIANHIETQFKLNNFGTASTENTVSKSIEKFFTHSPTPTYEKVKASKIADYLKKIKIKKAPGCWKTARILPILKPGKDPTQPISYRPISLLLTLSKLSEKIILNRYVKHANKVRIPIPQQFGFTPQLSTTHQLLRVTEHILEGIFANLATATVFLDIAKAFGKVWTQGLIHKLIAYKFPHYVISIIHSYLQDRQFVVKVKNTDSSPRNIHAGVPQGGILAPIIFLCFMNDIPQQKDITLSLYADDTAILAQGKKFSTISNSLSNYIPKLESWLKRWKIQLNVEKQKLLFFLNILSTAQRLKYTTLQFPGKKKLNI